MQIRQGQVCQCLESSGPFCSAQARPEPHRLPPGAGFPPLFQRRRRRPCPAAPSPNRRPHWVAPTCRPHPALIGWGHAACPVGAGTRLLAPTDRGGPVPHRPGLSHGGALHHMRRPRASDAPPFNPSTAVSGACHLRSFCPQHACSCSQQVPQQTAASLADSEGSPDAFCIRKWP